MTKAANGLGRALVAEFIGTFALIFIGAGAAIALGVNHDPPVAFAHGLTILVFVAAFGDISGGHFNPAVTTGLAVAGVFPSRRVVPYLIASSLAPLSLPGCCCSPSAAQSITLAPHWSTRSASHTPARSCSRLSARAFFAA